MIITKIICDCGCKRSIELGDEPVDGAEELIQTTDAMGHKLSFLTTACFKKFAADYKCPFKPEPKPKSELSLDDVLPGGTAN